MTLKLLTLLVALAGANAFVLPPENINLRGPPELPVPTRPLEWGDVNFLSTSDTHGELRRRRELTAGWLRGHQHVCIIITTEEQELTAEHLARARTPSGKLR